MLKLKNVNELECSNLKNLCFTGTQVLSTMWASEANILVGLHDASYTIWYCPGEACTDPTVIALTKYTFHIP